MATVPAPGVKLPPGVAGWANPSNRKVRASARMFLDAALDVAGMRDAWAAKTLTEAQRKRLGRAAVVMLRDEARSATELFRMGYMRESDWRARIAEITGAGSLAVSYALEGATRINPSDRAALEASVAAQFDRLGRYFAGVADGTIPRDGRITTRAMNYATSAWSAAQAVARAKAIRTGLGSERNALGPAEHCPGCLREAAKGWQPIGTLVPIGERDCKVNCRCSYEFRAGKAKPAPRPKAKAKPKPPPPEPEPEPPPPPAWPDDPEAVEVVRTLGGSTGAELVRDPRSGRVFVRKRGANADHLREEVAADALYRAFGVPVPEGRLYETAAGPVKLAEFIEGRTLAEFRRTADPMEVARVERDLRRNFVADAVLGNWDVVGLSEDNVLVGNDGVPYRIDNGGSLRFRAQGARKAADQWDAHPVELWTLRDARTNAQTARVYGSATAREIAEQAGRLDAGAIDRAASEVGAPVLPDEVAAMVRRRLAQAKDVGRATNTLLADDFIDPYADQFTRHVIGLRKAGVVDRMPSRLDNRGSGVTVYDENGKAFDHLRGPGSLVESLKAYVDGNGGEYAAIRAWAGGQAGNSWNAIPASVKYWLANQRDTPLTSYWWKNGEDDARRHFEAGKQRLGEKYDPTFTALHAFTWSYLDKADFPNKDAARGVVRLKRTENAAVMAANKLKPGDQDVKMQRGPLESTSIYQTVTVYGSELTTQDVPIHRVFATYWQERAPGHGGSGMFLGDHENEFLAMLDDVPFTYERRP